MSEQFVSKIALQEPKGEAALNAAAMLWFIVLFIGQGLFLYFILAFYAPGMMSGDLEGWNRHPMISDPYVRGDGLGNAAFASHIVLAVVITLGGTIQLIPWVRARAIGFHRWNGRAFMMAAIGASLSGFYAVWFRDAASDDIVSDISISLNGTLILVFAGMAWRMAAMRNIDAHRRWALRAFMVTNGVFFLRFGFGGWLVMTQTPPSSETFHIFAFLSYLLPLAITELYLRAKEGSLLSKRLMAGVIIVAAAYLATGFFGFYFVFMKTILGAATV
jgi:hypothetical protein